MTRKRPYLGSVKRKVLDLNPAGLLAGHMLVGASSGGGKSWLIRRLLEQTHGV